MTMPGAPAKSLPSRGRQRLSKAAFRDLAAFRFSLRQFLSFSDAAASSMGITTQQYQALLAIKASADEAMTIKELAQEMLVAQNGAVQLVDRLQAQDYVERSESATDRRRVIVRMTATGDRLLRQLAGDHLAELLRQQPLLAESLQRLKQLGRPE